MDLSNLKGFGPKRLELLKNLQINSSEDLLRFFPREYLNLCDVRTIAEAKTDEPVTLKIRVAADPSIWYSRGKTVVTVRVCDDSAKLLLRFLNQPYRMNQFGIGKELYVHGKITNKRGLVMYNPRTEQDAHGILPIYDLPKGLPQSVFREALREVLQREVLPDFLPEFLIGQYSLPDLNDSFRQIHFPTNPDSLYRAEFRFRFEEALLYFLAVKAFRESARLQNGVSFQPEGILDAFIKLLPFVPTNAQMRVLREVEHDMHSRTPMNRLIQGDVGSGKTIIAEYALYVACASGKQGAFLVPTEILAQQHYEKICRIFGNRAVLYTGSGTAAEKKRTLEQIRTGEASVVVGTHALLSERVQFSDLGLIVTDEQHRFGVEQRAKMEQKGIRPDVLVMSATPIPRTLALLLYADLSLSSIDEMPAGRTPVQTNYIPQAKRQAMYRFVSERIVKQNERAYVVCPLIEKTESFENLSAGELFAELKKLLPSCSVGLLHGRMKETEKKAVMEQFRSGDVQMLVSTTVVEVGVDVPEATYMIIEGADHFGLATLHQLRGRVGRSDRESFCYLLSSHPSENAKERIRIMLSTNDGFALAQKDMDLRGYGDLFGVRQSGDGSLARFLGSCTVDLIGKASEAAEQVLNTPSLQNNELIRHAEERYIRESTIARN